ncbi:hypothetical protein TNCV_4119111 [Trichonephila clavipes]|nr:hypothetical protein TNCV_4119111 [Trichonephila clavipes]
MNWWQNLSSCCSSQFSVSSYLSGRNPLYLATKDPDAMFMDGKARAHTARVINYYMEPETHTLSLNGMFSMLTRLQFTIKRLGHLRDTFPKP